MKNEIDYIYEYSDLNPYYTRVKILTGEYQGVILEFGHFDMKLKSKKKKLTFDFTLYEKPTKFENVRLKEDKEFTEYLSEVLISILEAREADIHQLQKFMEAEEVKSTIKINERFYSEVSTT
jgi:hypothetical protein